MQVEIKIDDQCPQIRVLVISPKMTDEVQEILKRLGGDLTGIITGFDGYEATILPHADIIRIFSGDKHVYAKTQEKTYMLKQRLYEVEQRLTGKSFVRISNYEIINLKKVRNFDLSFTGTIYVYFTDGTRTSASRRYVAKIKKILGI